MIPKDILKFAEHFEKIAKIRKLPNGKYRVLSEKGKNLGTYDSKQDAAKRLKQIEMFKYMDKNKAEDNSSYSATMRELNKFYDKEVVEKFQKEFKKLFDQSLLDGENIENYEDMIDAALECIDGEEAVVKTAAKMELGDPSYAGRYLADMIKFLFRRISPEKRQKALETMKKKVYFINEYDIASKKIPASAAYGQSITLLKHILIENSPTYIRAVLNNIVRNL